ncbi:OmpH family outer membrane protein [Flavobacterium litorale]|uniref:OmpH family outer membrane protein n=1 Tax=Flavobacterium litorale TaxID=2856519 RepID=A0ABX8VEH0_9FLAO|nr:OmpH family outer membrane protein [Flavobacterium litorale]QYJ69026.1 OmpH family outer membrane protein [Flavobacterium litorale]
MKKSLILLAAAFAMISCKEETTSTSGLKTAYIDTIELMNEYEELKDWESKGNIKKAEMERELTEEGRQLELDAASFQNEAKSKGMQWAELKYQELQKRQRDLGIKQESMYVQLQKEFGVQRDTIIIQMKDYIKEYAKKEGYDYVYGTGDAASILYGKEEYDITDVILKELNDRYKNGATKTEGTLEAKEEDPVAAE